MQFMAHGDAFNSGESEGFSHFVSENGLKIVFISFVFIAVTYAVTIYLTKQSTSTKQTTQRKKQEKEVADD